VQNWPLVSRSSVIRILHRKEKGHSRQQKHPVLEKERGAPGTEKKRRTERGETSDGLGIKRERNSARLSLIFIWRGKRSREGGEILKEDRMLKGREQKSKGCLRGKKTILILLTRSVKKGLPGGEFKRDGSLKKGSKKEGNRGPSPPFR